MPQVLHTPYAPPPDKGGAAATSEGARAVLVSMLQKRPLERPRLDELCREPWVLAANDLPAADEREQLRRSGGSYHGGAAWVSGGSHAGGKGKAFEGRPAALRFAYAFLVCVVLAQWCYGEWGGGEDSRPSFELVENMSA